MLDLFIHLLLLRWIGQTSNASCERIPSLLAFWTCQHFFLLLSHQSYAPYVSIFFCWPSLHCSTCLRACTWWKRIFHTWSCYITIPWINTNNNMTKLLCIHTSSWFSFDCPLVWPFLLHLSSSTYHPFLESHGWDSQWDIYLGSWTLFWRFHRRIFKILALQMFIFLSWWRFSKILNHGQIFFHRGWVPILCMLLLHEYLELYLPCSYILEDISTHAFLFLS